jgi:phage terminase large subunit-like protein
MTKREDFSLIPHYDPYRDAGDEYYYDSEAGEHVVQFFREHLKFTKGRFKGKPFIPEPWQEQLLKCIFGWKRKSDGQRRYRTVFLYVSRKNGKSQLCAGIALYCLFFDNEPDAEIYIAARDREQAGKLYQMVQIMASEDMNPSLASETYHRETKKLLTATWDNSFIQAVSSDGASQHGGSPSVALIDELHAHQDYRLVEALDTGMGEREQPLSIKITTADLDRDSMCNDELAIAEGVRDGRAVNARYLPCIFQTPKEMDWTNEDTWKIANPTYPITPRRDYMIDQVNKAKQSKRLESSFKRYNLNMKTSGLEGWLNMDAWAKCKARYNEEELHGQECYAAFDLAYRTDILALVLTFHGGETVCRFYGNHEQVQNDKTGKLQEFVDAGLLIITGEQDTDNRMMKDDLLAFSKVYTIKETAFDRANAQILAKDLEDEGLSMREFAQTALNYNEPTQETEVRVLRQEIKWNNEVLNWMAGNAMTYTNRAGLCKPVKQTKNSGFKVDGIQCLVMCVGLFMLHEEEDANVYQDRGMIDLMEFV